MEEAIELAETGVGCAQGFLGTCHRDGVYGFPKDLVKARTWLERGVKSEDAYSMFHLGELLFDQKAGKEGAEQARLLWKRAAYHGMGSAAYKYGVFLYAGAGGPTNEKEARRLLQMAANGGVKGSYIHLSRLLSLGIGGPADQQMAVYWEQKAMEDPDFLAYLQRDTNDALRMSKLATSPEKKRIR